MCRLFDVESLDHARKMRTGQFRMHQPMLLHQKDLQAPQKSIGASGFSANFFELSVNQR